MKQENQIIIVSGFLGFAIGTVLMMMIPTPPGSACYDIIEEIEFEVCEECWYDVFECGDRYEEVEYYTTWE